IRVNYRRKNDQSGQYSSFHYFASPYILLLNQASTVHYCIHVQSLDNARIGIIRQFYGKYKYWEILLISINFGTQTFTGRVYVSEKTAHADFIENSESLLHFYFALCKIKQLLIK
ncbi:MAG: hypothetical protein ACRC2T_10195, partial [Thermoguttaceae bacterium]